MDSLRFWLLLFAIWLAVEGMRTSFEMNGALKSGLGNSMAWWKWW